MRDEDRRPESGAFQVEVVFDPVVAHIGSTVLDARLMRIAFPIVQAGGGSYCDSAYAAGTVFVRYTYFEAAQVDEVNYGIARVSLRRFAWASCPGRGRQSGGPECLGGRAPPAGASGSRLCQ